MTVHEKFVDDMRAAGIETIVYHGRFFWDGPAARSDQQHGPTLQNIVSQTPVPLQWDHLDSGFIVYPAGVTSAIWNEYRTDSDGEEIERDGYTDAYAAKSPKDVDEDED